MKGTRLYILGAGCSCAESGGYPLAKSMLPGLRSYAEQISESPDHQQIYTAVQKTIKLLEERIKEETTIDKLIESILKGKCEKALRTTYTNPANQHLGLQMMAIRDAKLAICAWFLEREGDAREALYDRYRAFMYEVFSGFPSTASCLQRLEQSEARVLSFNYDRMFEIAFCRTMADLSVNGFATYSPSVLNSGLTLDHDEVVPIKADRFSFLKLHGSIGFWCHNWRSKQRIKHGDIMDWKAFKVNDELFFPSHSNRTGGIDQPEPMIVFPYEKDYALEQKNNGFPFKSYIKTVWSQAEQYLRDASQINIIGYSFDLPDSQRITSILKGSNKSTIIRIQNLPRECNRIHDYLKYRCQITATIEKVPLPF